MKLLTDIVHLVGCNRTVNRIMHGLNKTNNNNNNNNNIYVDFYFLYVALI